MNHSQGFAPVASRDARRLILGSMPGVASLNAGRYYAFPRNAFWEIMGELFGAGPDLDYTRRLQVLTANGIALWDVVESCQRPGSLDAAIVPDSIRSNDFNAFFAEHPGIDRVYFNGQKAAQLFRKMVLPGLEGNFEFHTLPSTSPAHASRNFNEKLLAWSVVQAD